MSRLVLSLLAVVAMIFAAATPAAADGSRATTRPLQVLSYNIHHGADHSDVLNLQLIADEIRSSKAEVVGLQEVDNHWGTRSDWVDQAAWLAKELGMYYCFGANLDLPPGDGQTQNRQYGTAILSKFEIRSCTNTLLPNHVGGEQRGLLQAQIKARGVDFVFMNTHLTHNNQDGRIAQSAAINEILAATSKPVVLVGDFNATPESLEYATFTAAINDAWTMVGEGPGYTYPVEAPDRRIDYLFVSDAVTPVSMHVGTTEASDHLPLEAKVNLPVN